MSDVISTSARAGLSRDLTEFLVELSVALHRHSMYPGGHPALEPAIAAVVRRAGQLLAERPSIAFGVARRQLIIEGVATDPHQPVLRRLAETLHKHHLGAVTVLRGVDGAELGEALRALAAEPERDGPLGLDAGRRRTTTWPHLRLHPVSFDGLALVADAPLAGQAGSAGETRAAELWIGLARAALAADESVEPVAVPLEPADVARSIEAHPRADAYDQSVIGYVLQIAQELKHAGSADAAALRVRTSALISQLRPDTLRRLVEMGGDAAQRGGFVLDAAQGMAVDAVVDIARAAAEAGGQTISHGLMRMLTKLAAHAESGPAEARPLADAALRDQVARLQANWSLADPNPDVYGRVLQHLATRAGAEESEAGEAATPELDPLRVLQMSLEAGTAGPLVLRAVDRAVGLGQVTAVLDLLGGRPDHADAVYDAVVTRLVAPSTIRVLLDQEPIDIAGLDGLLPFLTTEGYELLLDALASADNRATRRRLLDRLTRTAPDLGLAIAARLQDERWYVQRNMLVLLERSGRIPPGFSPAPWTVHEDPRLRCEAIRVQLKIPAEREMAVATALADPDARVLRLGLAAVQDEVPPAHANRVLELAGDAQADEDVRLLAIAALAGVQDLRAHQALVALVDGGRTLLGRQRLAPKSPVLLAALRALASRAPAEGKASALLAAAAGSTDDDVREAARRADP